MSARAIATRCFWPPLNWSIFRWSKPASLTRSRARPTRSTIASRSSRFISRPNATLSNTLMWGKRARCWKIMLVLRA